MISRYTSEYIVMVIHALQMTEERGTYGVTGWLLDRNTGVRISNSNSPPRTLNALRALHCVSTPLLRGFDLVGWLGDVMAVSRYIYKALSCSRHWMPSKSTRR
jgi:hypothetical protein